MSRPERVRVGAYYYDIIWRDNKWSELCDYQGKCSPRDRVIEINGEMPADCIACTFAHEVSHALEWHYKRWDDVDSEVAATINGEGMVMFWRDNPEVFEWWVAIVKG